MFYNKIFAVTFDGDFTKASGVKTVVYNNIMAIIIGIVNKMGESGIVDAFVDGADDMVGVILVIAIARGATVLMGVTYLDNYIIYNAAELLAKMPEFLFVPLNYILHIVLSILVPSSSGLASLSTPILSPFNVPINNDLPLSLIISCGIHIIK